MDFSLRHVSRPTLNAVQERNFANYYSDRLWASDTVLSAMIGAVEKAMPDGQLFALLEAFHLAQDAAMDRVGEVEEYIKRLESMVAAGAAAREARATA